MSDLRPRVHTSLGGGYTLGRELGGGGMARVFVARDEQLGRDVVVKVLAPALAQALSAERFTREIRLVAALQEPHILPVLTAGTTADGLPWYAMPYVEGESLRARLAKGPVSLAEAVGILRDVGRALAYAHGRGIVHRDVKPENVLLSSGTAVVTDFGIAKALSASRTQAPEATDQRPDHGTLTQVGTSLGTPAYMAPEQAAADPDVDHRADLYAWGVLAYELLAGRHPFAGKTSPQQLLAAHLAELPAPLASTGPAGRAVPPRLAALVTRCLAKDPAARPASAAALLAGLDDAVRAGGPTATVRRARLGALAVVALVVAAGAGTAWRRRTPAVPAEAGGPVMLAVLPFEHAGPADQAVFTDGLTDAVTAKLGRLPGLAVIDRQSAAQYRRTTKSAKQIGAELGVPYLLQGVVRWARDGAGAWRAQVTPTLVDARAGTTRWTGEPAVITPADPFTA
jgi:eukaryotic-like serine/threonine-protein kinase